MLPVDHVVAAEFEAGAANEVVETIPDGKMASRHRAEDDRASTRR